MKKFKWVALTLVLALALGLALTACGGGGSKYTVSFDQNYEGAPRVTSVKVVDGRTVDAKTVTRSGYVLEGWYLDQGCVTKYDFSLPVSASMTLYAKWTEGTGNSNDPSITLSKTTAALDLGASDTISATPVNAVGATVTWTSSDSSTVSIVPNGNSVTITGVKSGTANVIATITVGGSNYTKTCTVTVGAPKLTVTPATATLNIGQKQQLSTAGIPAGTAVTWTSSSANATVSATGEVTGVSEGTAIITAKATVNGAEAQGTCTVTVSPPGWTLPLSKYAVVFDSIGATDSATVTGGGAVTWASSDASVATVDAASGLITAVAPGYAFAVATGAAGIGKVSVWVKDAATLSTPISTPQDFSDLIKSNWNGNFHLTQDIDFAGTQFTPLGKPDVSFAPPAENFGGTLDGRGFALKNIEIDWTKNAAAMVDVSTVTVEDPLNPVAGRPTREYGSYGIFVGLKTTAVIRNLNVIDIQVLGHKFIGGICGKNTGLIENCYVSGKITNDTWWYGLDCPGGMIAGINNGTIRNCITNAQDNQNGTDAFGNSYTWGICGWNQGAAAVMEKCMVVADNLSPAQPDEFALATAVQANIVLTPAAGCLAIFSTAIKFSDFATAGFGAQWVFEQGKLPYLIK
ncbi:MAG: Ig-like domain-containing protein [Firmicutes bacterium]|nr:Ig-like domain-containing protein [Bacillota bacterium]